MGNIKQISSKWELVLENANYVLVEAFADPGSLDYSYNLEGDYLGISVNDTADLIHMIQTASNWLDARGEEDTEDA